MQRRAFLQYSTAASMALAFGGFPRLSTALERKGSLADLRAPGFGPLQPTAARNTGETVLALPRGFSYNVLGRTGDMMSDGRRVPADHDGMAAFEIDGELRLVRNHEINDDVPVDGSPIGPANHYDEQAGGGTTTLVIDPGTRLIRRDFVSLSGTLNNCAGGPTPTAESGSCRPAAATRAAARYGSTSRWTATRGA
ncbi:MAG: DUF839 domain-containing protein [Woeseiaceae bacterium]|nr:DUF839 domain-containing protein [Woeseiaceae bacterium]